MIGKLDAHLSSVAGKASRAVAECEELRGKYQRECMQRKLLYNKIQEMRGVRFRLCMLVLFYHFIVTLTQSDGDIIVDAFLRHPLTPLCLH